MLRRLLVALFLVLFCTAALNAQGRGSGGQQQRMPGTGGTITAIDGLTLTLKTFQGETATVQVSGSTEFRHGQQPARFSDLKVGDPVFVIGEQKDGVWIARAIRQPDMAGLRQAMGKRFVAGEIKKIDETRLTILRPDGETQVIEVDENTSFRNQKGESITLADIKTGDRVFGRGEVKNGTFVPRMLNVGDPAAGGMGPGSSTGDYGIGRSPQQQNPDGKGR